MKQACKHYAGIGSRKTPDEILSLMTKIASRLGHFGYVLRSGGANGADLAFEKGSQEKEIYLPWKGFNNNPSPLFSVSQEAIDIADFFHPAEKFLQMKKAIQLLMGRNAYQVLGSDLKSPVEFVLCWTPDASDGIKIKTTPKTGGTGQAIRMANYWKIPVQNLASTHVKDMWEFWLHNG